MFSIDDDFNILYSEYPIADVINFSTEAALLNIADVRHWSREDLEKIWNSFAGVVPFGDCKPAKRIKNRPTAVRMIWNAIQRLAPEEDRKSVMATVRGPAPAAPKKPKEAAKRQSRSASVSRERRHGNLKILMAMLGRKTGVTVAEAMERTGWTATHTVRGRISILGSKGTKIERFKDGTRGTAYRIVA
jgi:Protein of unknown function (DUF3489)